ncbi:hypothetical protein LTLLF_156505 [Microtus ochrogaster]|uniref:Uncharacterized protein n=1 Tax=Microtus ochrogaster TaxID=79684 RepID=A0A8J6GI62_MICOH|nr:hypothetical protein LTLLF_156505 [Microtus ochrogaster]
MSICRIELTSAECNIAAQHLEASLAFLALPGARSESWLRWSQHGARSPLALRSE